MQKPYVVSAGNLSLEPQFVVCGAVYEHRPVDALIARRDKRRKGHAETGADDDDLVLVRPARILEGTVELTVSAVGVELR